MPTKQAEIAFLQIEEQLNLIEEEHYNPEETLKSCLDLFKMVYEKSLQYKIKNKEESDYVVSSMSAWLAQLYPRNKKKQRKKMELSPEERKRRSEHMKKVMARKMAERKKKETSASKKKV